MAAEIRRLSEAARNNKATREELTGSTGVGYHYAATDRTPTPGEYKRMDQVMLLSDAKNVDEAYQFLNFIAAPENAAGYLPPSGCWIDQR